MRIAAAIRWSSRGQDSRKSTAGVERLREAAGLGRSGFGVLGEERLEPRLGADPEEQRGGFASLEQLSAPAPGGPRELPFGVKAVFGEPAGKLHERRNDL